MIEMELHKLAVGLVAEERGISCPDIVRLGVGPINHAWRGGTHVDLGCETGSGITPSFPSIHDPGHGAPTSKCPKTQFLGLS